MVNFSYFYFSDMLPGFFIFTLGCYALLKNPRGPLHLSFFIMTFFLLLVGVFGPILGTSVNIAEAAAWDGLHTLAMMFIFPSFFFFCLVFYSQRFWHPAAALIYLPALTLYFIDARTDLISKGWFHSSFGYYALPGPLHLLSYSVIVAYFICGFICLFSVYKKSEDPRTKNQAQMILIGVLFPLVIGTIFDVILPQLGISSISLLLFSSLFMSFFLFLAIMRYRLTQVPPTIAIETIVGSIPAALIITNTSGKIIYCNQFAVDLFKDKLINRNLLNLSDDLKIKETLSEIVQGKARAKNQEAIFKKLDGTTFIADINCARIKEQYGLLWSIIDLTPEITVKNELLAKQSELSAKIK
ncbi:MAG: PAS domain-containing protein, partial [Candidatus Margulisbacteria bacterium]|nr:PAS domain-containing protein [Candidatus Margulisiibacteriota bacterium]